jgi:hypothetical protein
VVTSRVVPLGLVSATDDPTGGINCCVGADGALVDDDVAVSFSSTTEVEGELALGVCVADLPIAGACESAFFSSDDFGRPNKARSGSFP